MGFGVNPKTTLILPSFPLMLLKSVFQNCRDFFKLNKLRIKWLFSSFLIFFENLVAGLIERIFYLQKNLIILLVRVATLLFLIALIIVVLVLYLMMPY